MSDKVNKIAIENEKGVLARKLLSLLKEEYDSSKVQGAEQNFLSGWFCATHLAKKFFKDNDINLGSHE